VAYLIKARIVKSQQPAITRQLPVNNNNNNNRGILFFAQTVPMAMHAMVEYVMPLLNNNFTAARNGVFCAVCAKML
jgi:hypothetical protein